jgi:hypothetical protein
MPLWPVRTTARWCRCCSVERKRAEQVNVTLVEMGYVYWLQARTKARYRVVQKTVSKLLNKLLPPSSRFLSNCTIKSDKTQDLKCLWNMVRWRFSWLNTRFLIILMRCVCLQFISQISCGLTNWIINSCRRLQMSTWIALNTQSVPRSKHTPLGYTNQSVNVV